MKTTNIRFSEDTLPLRRAAQVWPVAIALHLLGATFWFAPPAFALPPTENGDGTPSEPCIRVNEASAAPSIVMQGLPLTGCTVDLNAGGSKIELIIFDCHDPIYYDLPTSMPISWQLISWPGNPAPTFTHNSTLAALNLPRAGTYVVRFTICPSGKCSFRAHPGGTNYPIATASADLTIVAVNSIPIPAEEYPIRPASANAATQPVNVPDKDCKCLGGGGVVDPQWVTVDPWTGVNDYKFLEGSVFKAHIAVQDDFLDHDTHDVDFSITPDPRFNNLVSADSLYDEGGLIAVEWESGSYPERFRPTYGDRISVFGFWILDCGHPPSYTEIHPPVGIAVHRPRPIQIPSGQVFNFNFSDGTVASTAGNNVYVPGILTDIWFNRFSGENTRCGGTSLHQPAQRNQQLNLCFGGNCIQSPLPINRIFEFNIFLPRNPAVTAHAHNQPTATTPPLYMAVSNPWGFPGPDPVITPVTEGDVTYLRVQLDLRGFTGATYSRRIESAWVYPRSDNWGLARWRVSFPTLDVHDDQDPWTDWPNDDGDYRFWITVNNRDQEWTRILFGDDNAHGTKNFSPAWQTGSGDHLLWRTDQFETDSSHRLGPDVLAYPDQGVRIHTTAYESDAIWDDDPGRAYLNATAAGTRVVLSDEGNYSIHIQVQPGPAVGAATLSAASGRLNNELQLRCGNGPRFNPIDAVLAHPLEIKGFLVPGIADQSPWTVQGDLAASQLGSAVAGVGDVNGDGFADVLVGAAGVSNGTGKVSLFLGHPLGLSSMPFWSANGPQTNALFGSSVARAGDVNKDGFGDFVVGAPNYSNGQTNEGAVFGWLGGSSSNAPSASPNWMVEGNFPGAAFGFSVAAGDVNGDGFSDVIVGAPYYQNSISALVPLGRVFVYLGSSNGLALASATQLVPASLGFISQHYFGYSVAVADVNHDGFADVIVGAPHYSNGQANEGAVFVYYGSASGVGTTPGRPVEGGAAGAQFGFSVASAGDVNGDGYQDVLVGAPFYTGDDVTFEEGSAALFLGGSDGINPPAVWGVQSFWGGSHFGFSVAGVGDLNGDGFADFVVGSPNYFGQTNNEGRIHVYLGTNNPSTISGPIWVQASQLPNSLFGFAVAGVGDMNGDGFSDFLVGAPGFTDGQANEGEVYLYRGQGQREIQPRDDRFFESVDPEHYAFYNLRDPKFGDMLKATGQDDPVKLDRMLAALRTKVSSNLLGTARESDALAALAQLKLFMPANLWQQHFGDLALPTGGALYLNCGGTNETIDALGRRWKPDASFLVTSNSNVNPFAGQTVDASLLTDHSIPNNVLLTERWKDGDLRYEIPIENGLHTVILYLSENCSACVNTNLGGTGPAGTARIVDLEVEGWRTNNYNAADAAVSPVNDGQGATFKATQVIFRGVPVSDGILNVNILDRGTGNPPENAAIKAIAVFQSQSTLVAPRILSIRPVELNFQVQVDPVPNLAAYLAGLTSLALERSPDLVHWSSAGGTPLVQSGSVYFEFPPTGPAQFYRVVARSLNL